MRIGYVTTHFSPLSESFIRREVLALCRLGHRVFVYADCLHYDPQAPEPNDPNLVSRQIPFLSDPAALSEIALADGIDHLHGSLMSAAHRATLTAARALQTPFTFMAYSGLDVFTRRDLSLYNSAARDPLCVRIIVEDSFMQDWMTKQFDVPPAKLSIVPNSFDLDTYQLLEKRAASQRMVILSIARFVQKKGLIYLIEAFQYLSARHEHIELWLVGYGPEERQLRQAASRNERIKFHGAASEAETRRFYGAADIFCLPCIRTATGDADGIPTTILEAMAFELPVVCTDILSISCYVTNGCEGLLVPPRDSAALSAALERLSGDRDLRAEMGKAGRTRIVETCDIKRNVKQLEQILIDGRWANWRGKLAELERQRASYSPERQGYYRECRIRAVNYFQLGLGKLLDIGCWLGELRDYLPTGLSYYGCDTVEREEVRGAFPFVAAQAERLPFEDNSFDAAVFYAVLIHVFDVDRSLAEAARVLRPGGRLYLQECYDDPNPVHMNHFSRASLCQRVSEYFKLISSSLANDYLMMVIAEKPAIPFAPAVVQTTNPRTVDGRNLATTLAEKVAVDVRPTAVQFQDQWNPDRGIERGKLESQSPLVSICITTYNRAALVRESIDSVLRQSYRNVEVVVVDDGSTDDTRPVLESYGCAIRTAYNQTNQGMAFSKNRALSLTSDAASYVGILDSDDYFDPRFIQRCVDVLQDHREAGLVYTDDIMVDAAGRELWRQPAVEPWNMDEWLRTCNLRGDTWLAHRALVMQTNLHDEATEHDHDYDLFFQLLKITTFVHLPEFLAFIRQHEGRSTIANRLAVARDHAANLVKHGFSAEYAYLRARRNPEWVPAIEEGIKLGKQLSEQSRKACPL
jgi:glycosyltransferase involved in cell wall biosynthesis/SAM-dependent methyltransferase